MDLTIRIDSTDDGRRILRLFSNVAADGVARDLHRRDVHVRGAEDRPEDDQRLGPGARQHVGLHGGGGDQDQFSVALEAAIAENLREVEAIAANSAAATFDNTLVALERAGQTMNRVGAIYGVWSSAMSTL